MSPRRSGTWLRRSLAAAVALLLGFLLLANLASHDGAREHRAGHVAECIACAVSNVEAGIAPVELETFLQVQTGTLEPELRSTFTLRVFPHALPARGPPSAPTSTSLS